MRPSVLLLCGGPDAEREVSLSGGRAAAAALRASGHEVHEAVIERVTAADLRSLPGEVAFPLLHGPYGEGGPLQDTLELDGRPFVGARARGARAAMDKAMTKAVALALGVRTAPFAMLNASDSGCPLDFPVVVKPVHEGSSVGVHICRDASAWSLARAAALADAASHPGRVYMIEQFIHGRELTQGVIDPCPTIGQAGPRLPIVEIMPAAEFYDYEAKYHSDATRYIANPTLPKGVPVEVYGAAMSVALNLGLRHLCRVDFILDDEDRAWLLEVNTMPGFTDHSLLPMAAGAAGIDFPSLCARLVEWAIRDHAR